MCIRSRLVSQSNNKLNLSSEQLFNAMDLSPIIFSIILPTNPRCEISTNSQTNPVNLYVNRNSKVPTIKILLDSGTIASITSCYMNIIKFFKIKRINGQPWQGLLTLPL